VRLLVGFDGSGEGRDALELARVLCADSAGSVVVATVLFGGPLPVNLAGLDAEDAEEVEPLFEEAREALPGVDVETRAYGGASPTAILTVLAEEERFDAIVVGSPHRGAVGRALIGSVGRSLLNGAPCDVFIAPKGYAEQGQPSFRTIAVAYDGTPEAKVALRRAEGLAFLSNAIVKVMTVVTQPVAGVVPAGAGLGYAPPFPPEPDKVIGEAVDSVDARIGAQGQRLEGSPAEQIAEACAEGGVDLLVVGSRGYGPMSRVLLGSVSGKLVNHAPCPVLVVPRP
jgi:nucleotide-binding universal stress UspA family protein